MIEYVEYGIIILLMVIFSAFFSGSEISFNASNKFRLKKSAEEGSKPAKLAYKINEKFTEALSAILIGNNLANIAASTSATLIFTRIFANSSLTESIKSTIVTVGSTATITLIILICGEITPKIIAKQHADRLVSIVAYPVRALWLILFPIVKLVMLIVNLLRRTWAEDAHKDEPTVSESELSSIIDTVEEEGVIDEDKGNLLQSALEFPTTTVEEIMTPRTTVVAVDLGDDFAKNKKIIESSHYSRLPAYEDSIDNIVGVIYLNHYYKEAVCHDGEFDLRPILLKPFFLHNSMRLPTALRVMREKQTHIAVVVDEFGGTMGVVTLEDILEEIVGEIWDESDVIVSEIDEQSDGTFNVSGDMNIYDMFDRVNYDLHGKFESDYSTVGGWATEMLNAEPSVGDSFDFDNLTVTVAKMDGPRVVTVNVKVNPKAEEEEEED